MAMSVPSSSVRRAEKENSAVEHCRRKPQAKKKGLRAGWLRMEKEIKSVNRAGKSWVFSLVGRNPAPWKSLGATCDCDCALMF